jgi:hypothetical protein
MVARIVPALHCPALKEHGWQLPEELAALCGSDCAITFGPSAESAQLGPSRSYDKCTSAIAMKNHAIYIVTKIERESWDYTTVPTMYYTDGILLGVAVAASHVKPTRGLFKIAPRAGCSTAPFKRNVKRNIYQKLQPLGLALRTWTG